MNAFADIPEIRALDSRQNLIRIPHETDVPLTPRVRTLIDCPEMRRLARISQLGLVSLVYPAAHHTRFEHSLGVYRNALLYVKQLGSDPRFATAVSPQQAEVFIAAALLHDVGHWPFCHLIEDMRLPGVPSHELFSHSFVLEGEIADCLRTEWNIQPRELTRLVSGKAFDAADKICQSMLSGPIDIDKMDYLGRDSLHAGVPYGRNFDQQRLIGSLCLNAKGNGLAVTEKGRTAAEMMVFARYVMFSEVYWHHAVRSATAMLQRAFYLLHGQLDLDPLFRLAEQPMIEALVESAGNGPAAELLGGLFGPSRRLYKRVAEFSFFQQRSFYEQIARKPYAWLAGCSEQFADAASRAIGRRVAPHEVLIDAPPVKREVEFNVDVYFRKEDVYRPLADVSPAVHTLATRQFDDYVKRVRIFVHPRVAGELRGLETLPAVVDEALRRME